MTKNEVRKYLQQYKIAAMRLESLTAEHERIQSVLFSITAAQGGGAAGASNDRIGNGVSRLIDLSGDIDRAIIRYTNIRREVKEVISEVTRENTALGQCLHYRYIDFDDAQTCAYRMGYDPGHERKLHAAALEAAAPYIEKRCAQMRGVSVI